MEENPYQSPAGDLTPPEPEPNTYLSRLADAIAVLGVVCLVTSVLMCGGVNLFTAFVGVIFICVLLGGFALWRHELRHRTKLRRTRDNSENKAEWLPKESD